MNLAVRPKRAEPLTCWAILKASLKIQSGQFGITGIKKPMDILGRLEGRADFLLSCMVLIINQVVWTDG